MLEMTTAGKTPTFPIKSPCVIHLFNRHYPQRWSNKGVKPQRGWWLRQRQKQSEMDQTTRKLCLSIGNCESHFACLFNKSLFCNASVPGSSSILLQSKVIFSKSFHRRRHSMVKYIMIYTVYCIYSISRHTYLLLYYCTRTYCSSSLTLSHKNTNRQITSTVLFVKHQPN